MSLAVAFATIVGLLQASDQPLKPKSMTRELPTLASPRIIVKKGKRSLLLYDGDEFVKSYKVVLGFDPDADKEIEGDGRTPEGEFYIFTKNSKSRFHLSLGISYPDKLDADRGVRDGLITEDDRKSIYTAIDRKVMPLQKTPLGGEIYIHGGGVASDWTDGCVALDDAEIEELFNAVPVGTKVLIKP